MAAVHSDGRGKAIAKRALPELVWELGNPLTLIMSHRACCRIVVRVMTISCTPRTGDNAV